MEPSSPKTRPMTESEKAAYKQALDKGFERGRVYAPTPPPARRSLLKPVLLLLLAILGGVAGWAVTGLAERDRRIAALSAEAAQLRSDGERKLASVSAEAAATRTEAERVRAEQQRALDQMREAAAQKAARPSPPPQQSVPRPAPPRKKTISESIERPERYTPADLNARDIAIGQVGVFLSPIQTAIKVSRIIDENTAVMNAEGFRFIAVNYPTKGLADDKLIPFGMVWKVIGTYNLNGTTMYVLEQ